MPRNNHPIEVSVLIPKDVRALVHSLKHEPFVMIAWNDLNEPKIYVRQKDDYDVLDIKDKLLNLYTRIEMGDLRKEEK
jgi:hypothetical protein